MQLVENLLFAGRYILKTQLGRGGFSEVWLANDQWTGLDVAVKVYAPGQGMDEDGLKDFSKELANVYNLNHTNLLKPQHVDSWQGMPYLIMAFCEKGSCYKHVGNLKEEDAWKLISDVASGLAYLHSQEVIHQDIKPDNILIDANGNYLITDFGISVQARSTLRKSVRDASSGSGTTAYMAPERFSKDPNPIKASDIWSLGATVYELITGKLPFGEVGGGMQRSGASIPTISAPISSSLRQTIIKMLEEDPWDRPTASLLADWAQNPSAISLVLDEEIEQDGGSSFLKVKPNRINAEPVGGETKIFVKTDKEWRCLSEQQKWCTAKKSDNETIIVKYKPNQTGDERKTSINVIAGSRASVVSVSQASLPKSKSIKTLLLIIVGIIAVLFGILYNQHQRREHAIEGFKKKYSAEVQKCNIEIHNLGDPARKGDVIAYLKNSLESLIRIEDYEKAPLFSKSGLTSEYSKTYNQFKSNLTKAKKEVLEEYEEQKTEGLAVSSNTYYLELEEHLYLINTILEQANKVNASEIKIPRKQK